MLCSVCAANVWCGKKWQEGKHTLEDKIWKLESKSGTLYQKPKRKQNYTLPLTRNYPCPLNSPKCDKRWQVCICSTATYIGGGFFFQSPPALCCPWAFTLSPLAPRMCPWISKEELLRNFFLSFSFCKHHSFSKNRKIEICLWLGKTVVISK